MIVANVQNRLQRERRAFTLVELLVVIAIIGILAAMTLFTLYGVREDAKERRARAEVTKINELIMQQWESYRTRAVPVDTFYGTDPTMTLVANARRQLFALRELMRMELPDRKTDLMAPASDNSLLPAGQTAFLKSSASLWKAYVRRARQQIIGHYGLAASAVDAWKDNDRWTPIHEHAECLYLILSTMRDGDTTGLDFFTEAEIGDADNDGMPEILDPWGIPISFLRWAPGYRSDIQLGDINLAPGDDAGTGNGDSFDPLQADARWHDNVANNDPFVLFPLIMSAGRDHRLGILLDLGFPFDLTAPYPYAYDDPYVMDASSRQVGMPDLANGDPTDNITNHLIEVR